jgi:hypothetical protein
MAKGKGSGSFGGWLALAGLSWHVFQAIRHQSTCPRCRDPDLIEILFDVGHLWGLRAPEVTVRSRLVTCLPPGRELRALTCGFAVRGG